MEAASRREGLRIFISYRREEASGHAGRLSDRLAERFRPDSVFMDIDRIRPGSDFADVIDDARGSEQSRCRMPTGSR
jgi:hypothetical protein